MAAVYLYAFALTSLLRFCAGDLETEPGVLNIMFISSGGGQYNSSGVEPAVDLAVGLINENNIIPGYLLKVASRGDSSCDRTMALDAFFSSVSAGAEKIAVVGCGCSIATEPVAEISSYWNITHFSYASSANVLSNRERFPYFWRTHTSETNLAGSVILLMKQYGWKIIKIITQEDTLFKESTSILLDMLEESSIQVDVNGLSSFASSINVTSAYEFYQPEVRIYFLNMYSIHARRLICAAVLNNSNGNEAYYVPGYVWITLGWYHVEWWTEDFSKDDFPECVDAVLEPFILNQTIAIQQTNAAPDKNARSDVNLTAAEFKERYTALLNDEYFFEPTATYAYDAIWALAFAIQRSLVYFSQQEISIGNFSYATGRNITDIIQLQLENSTFDGVSGCVQFDEKGTRRGTEPLILKYRPVMNKGTEQVTVAVIKNSENFTYDDNETGDTVWPNGVPVDGSPDSIVIPIIMPLAIVYYVFATIGIIFSLVCLFFNIIFRNRKIVRLISPNLNYMIAVGGMMLYASVYFFILSSIDPLLTTISCHMRLWLQILGYFTCFGTIVVKIWRVYFIFHNPAVKRKKSHIPKDWHLFLIVMLMCLIMIVVMVCVAIFGNYKAKLVDSNEIRPTRNGTTKSIIEYKNFVCEGPRSIIWILFNYGAVVLTQVVAVILAFRTRKVTIKALNDSKYLTIIIYTSTVIIAIMITGAVILGTYLNADAALFGGLIIIFTTVVLGLTFIPKMIILYKDPKGENIFDRGQSQGTLNLTAIDDARVDNYNDLEKHCKEMETRLGKYETVVPFRNLTRSSSVRKYSSSMNYISQTPVHSVNPLNSVPTTPTKYGQTDLSMQRSDKKLTNATSDYLSEDSSNEDKADAKNDPDATL